MSSREECIRICMDCHRICLEALTSYCLEEGGAHVEKEHVKLMLDCIQICQTSADYLIRNSASHHLTCSICSVICQKCADNCAEVGDMDDCVEICRKCSASCQQMAA